MVGGEHIAKKYDCKFGNTLVFNFVVVVVVVVVVSFAALVVRIGEEPDVDSICSKEICFATHRENAEKFS